MEMGNYRVVKRDQKGKFSRGVSKVKLVLIVAVLAAIGGAIYCGEVYLPKQLDAARESSVQMVSVAEAAEMSPDTLKVKIAQLRREVIDSIAQCESGNASQDTALVKYDNNKGGTLTGKSIASIGVMQMKVPTMQGWAKELKISMTNYEATILALNNEQAKAFADRAIFEIQGAVFAWTCANPDYAAPAQKEVARKIIAKVELIKELMK